MCHAYGMFGLISTLNYIQMLGTQFSWHLPQTGLQFRLMLIILCIKMCNAYGMFDLISKLNLTNYWARSPCGICHTNQLLAPQSCSRSCMNLELIRFFKNLATQKSEKLDCEFVAPLNTSLLSPGNSTRSKTECGDQNLRY